MYGRARAFELVGDCTAAQSAYEQYADAVRRFDAKSADMAVSYASLCAPRSYPDAVLSAATAAILARDDSRALALLDSDPSRSPWVQYERGVALAGLHRTDEAVKAFDSARDTFEDRRDRAMAVYGKARAYHDALRCGDAITAYREYASMASPADAELARAYSRECVKYTW